MNYKRKDIANESSFSNPEYPEKVIPLPEERINTLSDFTLSCLDFENAIDEINLSSSGPDFSLPAIVLKKCKRALAIPLQMIWKESLRTGIVPAFYKKQIVTPVYKKGSRTSAANYRPISLTAHEVKIFERIIRDKMMEFLESQHLLSSNQHGFRKGRSCLTQLLKHYDYIIKNLLNNNETDTIYLDYSKAFDRVDHNILIQKLKNIGIRGKLCDWIENFLSERTQVVVVDGILSYVANVVSGVPQGTVLGPLLFLIFSNDLENYVNSCNISSFADDTRISRPISISNDSQFLQSDLHSVAQWSSMNNMKLHEDKFVYLNFNTRSTKFPLANLPFHNDFFKYETSEGELLEPSSSVTDLGITLTDKLNWSLHVTEITKTAKRKAGWSLSIFKDRSPYVMKTLYKSLIRSHLEYACPLWIGLSKGDIQRLEAIQRYFTNKITCPAEVDNYWDRLKFLKMMSLQRRRERYAILHMWKLLKNKISNDLDIRFTESRRHGITAEVPPIQRSSNSKAKSLYELSFAVKGPQLWNIVPKDIKMIDNLTNFKSKLDNFLYSIPDRPPVAGYITQNDNSLLEWNIIRLHI